LSSRSRPVPGAEVEPVGEAGPAALPSSHPDQVWPAFVAGLKGGRPRKQVRSGGAREQIAFPGH